MNIAIVEPVGTHGGMTIYDLGVSAALADAGVEVTLLTSGISQGHSYVATNVRIKNVFTGVYGKERKFVRATKLLRSLYFLRRELRNHRYDICHLHIFTYSTLEYSLLVLCLLHTPKLVVNIHDPLPLDRHKPAKLQKLFTWTLGYTHTQVTTHTLHSQRTLKQQSAKLNVAVIPHSDIDFIHPPAPLPQESKAGLNLDIDCQYVLFFGQLKKTKGIDTLLNAWSLSSHKLPATKLLIVGRPWKDDSQHYKDMIQRLGISNSVIWRSDFIDDHIVPTLFGASICVVLPYRRIYSSGVLLRALGYACPVIVSDQAAFTEFISHNDNGLIFQTGCPVSLSDCIVSMVKSAELRSRLSARGHTFVIENHGWGSVGERLRNFFSSLVSP